MTEKIIVKNNYVINKSRIIFATSIKKRKMKEKEIKIIKSIQLEQSIFNEITELAKKEERSTNNMIKVLLLSAIEAKKMQLQA